jgi:LuxR family maltose regulon positive regulatory protein
MGTPLVAVQHGLVVNVPIEVGSAEWFAWLERIDAFAVEEPGISFTVQRVDDGASPLWLAFCVIDNDPRWVMLGADSDLTQERLRAAAHRLANWNTITPEYQVDLGRESGSMPHLRVTNPDLLVTKLEMPTVNIETLVRTQAMDRMDQVLSYPLTVVTGPTGYGKTTLTATWASETPARVAWLLLDENDNEPVRFSTHLLAALDRVVPGLLAAGLRYVKDGPVHLSDVSLISRLINALTSTAGHTVLVLDDYHTISQENTEIQNAMNYFVEHLPPQIHVVLLTRTCVPLRIPWMRVEGRLLELSIEDIRFTDDEARAFLERKTGEEIAPDASARIHQHTEGWVAGLQLAAMAFEDHLTPADRVADLLSENRNVVDFIADEVLKRLPRSVAENVLWMVALDRFNVALCDALPGIVESQTTLDTLERENAFLVPVDEPPGWYRFHRLFREVLWKRLQRTHKAQLTEFYRQASHWHEAHGITRDAVHYALHAGDEHVVVRIIRDLAHRVFESGSSQPNLRVLEQCLALLPEDLIVRYPQLALIQAQVLVQAGDLGEAELFLEAADMLIAQAVTVEGEMATAGDYVHMQDEIMQVRSIMTRLRQGRASAEGAQPPLTTLTYAPHPQAASSIRQRSQRMPQRTDTHHSSTVPDPPVIFERITEREMEVLCLLAKGSTNLDIADALTITVATVKRHLSNLYRKLVAKTRTQAVWRARALGLLDDLPVDSVDTSASHGARTQLDERRLPRRKYPTDLNGGSSSPGLAPG